MGRVLLNIHEKQFQCIYILKKRSGELHISKEPGQTDFNQHFFLQLLYLFIYIYFWLCWVLVSCEGLLQLRQAGATLHRGGRASHRRGPSCCGAQAPDAQAQQLWLTGPVAPRHVGSSQTRAQTHVPCIGRQTLNHCAAREALAFFFIHAVFQALFFACHMYKFIQLSQETDDAGTLLVCKFVQGTELVGSRARFQPTHFCSRTTDFH